MGDDLRGQYALIQYCPIPERMEFINVGLVLRVPELGFFEFHFVDEPKRVERLFGRQSKSYFDFIVQATSDNLSRLFKQSDFEEVFEEYMGRRANQVRITRLLDIRITGDPADEFVRLFEKLVAKQQKRARTVRARTRLRRTFIDYGVEHALDRPPKVDIEQFDIEVSAPYAYQNGVYNYLDSIQITGNDAHDLREVGKKAMEGHFLANHSPLTRAARLVVIADFMGQSEGFYQAVQAHLELTDVKLYRFDHIDLLVDDIMKHSDKRMN